MAMTHGANRWQDELLQTLGTTRVFAVTAYGQRSKSRAVVVTKGADPRAQSE
jgi:hypothetical protein